MPTGGRRARQRRHRLRTCRLRILNPLDIDLVIESVQKSRKSDCCRRRLANLRFSQRSCRRHMRRCRSFRMEVILRRDQPARPPAPPANHWKSSITLIPKKLSLRFAPCSRSDSDWRKGLVIFYFSVRTSDCQPDSAFNHVADMVAGFSFTILYRATRRQKRAHIPNGQMRSMIINADKTGVDSTSSDDMRITRVGHFIRRFKIDELVQLWNVL